MTIANQIYKRFKSIAAFSRYCHEKYGVNANYIAKGLTTRMLTDRIRSILEQEGIDLSEEEGPQTAGKNNDVVEYLRRNAEEIKNWRAGL